jgi:hypothetical protein
MRKSMGVNGEQYTLGLIFEVFSGIDKQKVLERLKVLEREKVLERFKVLERYDFSWTFSGWAITVTDTTGADNFDDFIEALAADDEIAWFEPDFSIEMPVSSSVSSGGGQQVPWSVAAVGGQFSTAESGNGSGSVDVDVYVVDSGVSNSDLNVVSAIDFRGNGDVSDVDGHGTHVAGIIGAIDDADGLVGIAPGARIHNMKVLEDNGKTDVSVVVAAMEYIIGQKQANPSKPMVVNMSIGENIGSETYTSLDEAVRSATQAGIVVVVSAGNYGENANNVTPAHVDEAITVGAYGVSRVFSYYSNYGPKLDILAPGDDVISLSNSGSGSHAKMSGTSMATAHVSGAAALLLSQDPGLTPAQVLARLKSNAISDIMSTPSNTTRDRMWVGKETILFVLPNASSPSNQDEIKRSLFESWGYNVSYISANSSQSSYNQALGNSDVVFISEETLSGDVSTKLSYTNVGVVAEEGALSDEFGITSGRQSPTGRTVSVTNVSHYITEPFSGSVTLFNSDQPSLAYGGTTAPGLQVLAKWGDSSGLITIDAGAQTYSIGSSPGRRVMLPFGGNDFDAASLSNDGKTLLRRSFEWAAGVDGGSATQSTGSNSTATTTVTTGSVDVQIATGMDDVEEELGGSNNWGDHDDDDSGDIYHDSSDLEVGNDGSKEQLVGLRFTGIGVPAGATITNAYIQFTVDETNGGSTNVTIRGQDVGDAPAFTTSDRNVSNRSKTSASVNWQPESWTSVGSAGSKERTPNLSNIINEIVSRNDWNSGNDIVIMIEGSGERTAESYEGSSSKAAKLHIDYEM